MKNYRILVTYSVMVSTVVEVQADDDIDALTKAADDAPVPNNTNIDQFDIEDFQQFELSGDDILSGKDDDTDEDEDDEDEESEPEDEELLYLATEKPPRQHLPIQFTNE